MNENRVAAAPGAELTTKHGRLVSILRQCRSAVIGYSGSVPSLYLARAALDVLGPRAVLAVTGRQGVGGADYRAAAENARRFGIPHAELPLEPVEGVAESERLRERRESRGPDFWSLLVALAGVHGYETVLDAELAGRESGEPRLAHHRASELGVRSPLREAGLGGAEVDELARRAGLTAASPHSRISDEQDDNKARPGPEIV